MHTKTSGIKQTKSLFPLWATRTQKITWFPSYMSNPLAITPTSCTINSSFNPFTLHKRQFMPHPQPPNVKSLLLKHPLVLSGSSLSTYLSQQLQAVELAMRARLISLLLRKTHLNNRVLLQQHHSQSVNQS